MIESDELWPERATGPETARRTWVQRWSHVGSGTYDTGWVVDGHRVLRNECDEDGVELVHLDECRSGLVVVDGHPVYTGIDCPLDYAHESGLPVLEFYVEGDCLTDDDLDRLLPRGVEVEVYWRYYSCVDNWGEFDYELSWAFGHEPEAAKHINREDG